MKIIDTPLDGVYIIEPNIYDDTRGYFMESYNRTLYNDLGIKYEFVQDNQSFTYESGVIRGLHYQLPPKAQTKLVRVVTGAIYDVVVDIRRDSSTFGQWFGIVLNETNQRQLLVPKGYAHGFCTLLPRTTVFYKVDEFYSKEHERGLAWNDLDVNIDWPVQKPYLSKKDRNHLNLKNAQLGEL